MQTGHRAPEAVDRCASFELEFYRASEALALPSEERFAGPVLAAAKAGTPTVPQASGRLVDPGKSRRDRADIELNGVAIGGTGAGFGRRLLGEELDIARIAMGELSAGRPKSGLRSGLLAKQERVKLRPPGRRGRRVDPLAGPKT